jgi:hypothetical protein
VSTIPLSPSTREVASSKSSWRRSKFWQSPNGRIALVLSLNSLLILPAALLMANQGSDWVLVVLSLLIGSFFAEIYLLAFWMMLGETPQKWRSLKISGIACAAGFTMVLVTSVAYALQGEWDTLSPEGLIFELTQLVVAPILCAFLLWSISAAFILPRWYFGIAIDFHQWNSSTPCPKRTFGIPQLMLWVVQFSIPLALLQIANKLSENEQGGWDLLFFVAINLISYSPIAFVLLCDRLSPWRIGASILIAAACTAVCYFGPFEWLAPEPSFMLYESAGGWLTVALNMLLLRRLGLRWLPFESESKALSHACN